MCFSSSTKRQCFNVIILSQLLQKTLGRIQKKKQSIANHPRSQSHSAVGVWRQRNGLHVLVDGFVWCCECVCAPCFAVGSSVAWVSLALLLLPSPPAAPSLCEPAGLSAPPPESGECMSVYVGPVCSEHITTERQNCSIKNSFSVKRLNRSSASWTLNCLFLLKVIKIKKFCYISILQYRFLCMLTF